MQFILCSKESEMLQCHFNSYINNRNLKFALKNCAFQRVGTFHRRTGCTECQLLLLCQTSDHYFHELYHGHTSSRESFTWSLQLPLPCPNSERGKASSHAHGRAGSLQWWTLRQERGLIFLSASFKPDIKSTLLHSHSEITKASQQQGLPLGTMWLLGKFLSEQAPKQNINNLQHRLSLFLQLLLHFRRQTVLKDCRLLLLLETLLSTMTSNTLVS